MAAQSTYSLVNDGTGYVLTSAEPIQVATRGIPLSVGGWVKGNSSRCFLWGQGDVSRNISCVFNSGVLNFTSDLAAGGAAGWNCDLSDGAWHHLLLVGPSGWVSNTDFVLYIDGSLASTTTSNDGFGPSNLGFVLGGRGSGSFGYVGQLDDWFACASDVSAHAAAIAGTPGVDGSSSFDIGTLTNLILWRAEAGSGSTITDTSGNGHDGTITGGITWSTLNDVAAPLKAASGGGVIAQFYYPLLLGCGGPFGC